MESLWRDVTLAARMLRRTPGVTLSAIVMLALGIGAATAVFSIAYAALLRPFRTLTPIGGRICTRRLPV